MLAAPQQPLVVIAHHRPLHHFHLLFHLLIQTQALHARERPHLLQRMQEGEQRRLCMRGSGHLVWRPL